MVAKARTALSFGSWHGGRCPGGAFFSAAGRQAESLGFDGLYVGDHVVYPAPISESLTTLAFLAASTSRLKLGPMVLLLGLRNPLIVAKQLATIDHLSEGRLVVGIGVGGEVPEEWNACGVETTTRGARTDAYLDAIRPMLSGKSIDAHGAFLNLESVSLDPTGPGAHGPQVWIGGRSEPALARAARHDGWCAYAESPRGFARKRAIIDGLMPADRREYAYSAMIFTRVASTREAAARELQPRLRTQYGSTFAEAMDRLCAYGTPDEIRERLDEYVRAGANEVILAPMCSEAEWGDQVAGLARAAGLASSGRN